MPSSMGMRTVNWAIEVARGHGDEPSRILYSGRLPFQDFQIPRMACICFDLNATPLPPTRASPTSRSSSRNSTPRPRWFMGVQKSSPTLLPVWVWVKSFSGKLCNRCRPILAVVCRACTPSLIRDHVPAAMQAERGQLYRKQGALQGARIRIPLSCPITSITRSFLLCHQAIFEFTNGLPPLDARNEDGSMDALHGLIIAFIHTRIFKEQHWIASHDGIST